MIYLSAMQTMDLYIKPYMARQAIAHNSGQMTLTQLRTAIDGDVTAKLPYICPRCRYLDPDTDLPAGRGLIDNPDNPGEDIECPTCDGWGATETPIETFQTFGTAVPPNVTQP